MCDLGGALSWQHMVLTVSCESQLGNVHIWSLRSFRLLPPLTHLVKRNSVNALAFQQFSCVVNEYPKPAHHFVLTDTSYRDLTRLRRASCAIAERERNVCIVGSFYNLAQILRFVTRRTQEKRRAKRNPTSSVRLQGALSALPTSLSNVRRCAFSVFGIFAEVDASAILFSSNSQPRFNTTRAYLRIAACCSAANAGTQVDLASTSRRQSKGKLPNLVDWSVSQLSRQVVSPARLTGRSQSSTSQHGRWVVSESATVQPKVWLTRC